MTSQTPPTVIPFVDHAGVYDTPAGLFILLEELTENYSRFQGRIEQFDRDIEALEHQNAQARQDLGSLREWIDWTRKRLEDLA